MGVLPPQPPQSTTKPVARIDPLAAPPAMEEPINHDWSFIPAKWKPVVAAVVAVSIAALPFVPDTWVLDKVLAAIAAIGAALGIVSTGAERK